VVDSAKPFKSGSQKGTFVGDPEQIHIHLVSDNTHIKVGGHRANFREGDLKTVQGAIDLLKANGRAGTSGYKNCMNWLIAEAKSCAGSRASRQAARK
jgi:hypothetical protein